MLCPDSKPGVAEVSVHPAHLLDSMERALPAALIPFCSYQANMSLLGKSGDQFPFVACDKFQPYILQGQLCYSLDLRDSVRGGSKGGKGNGLLLVLDPKIKSYENVKGEVESEVNNDPNHLASIYLSTMTPFTNSKNGSYALSVLKKMTGTAGFLRIPDEEKNCQVEAFEECNTGMYLNKVAGKCKCAPWALSSDKKDKVGPGCSLQGFSFIFR